ncbi:MAG: hypothetical protein U9R19_02715 [Bacteroidota bacterium]|nr:hypothetical protein [Bacteroidota bacterium]
MNTDSKQMAITQRTTKKTQSFAKKTLMNIKKSLKEVELHKKGKIELKTLDQLLDEL